AHESNAYHRLGFPEREEMRSFGLPAYLSRPRHGVLRGRGEGLGLLERDGGAPFRGMDPGQRAELEFLRFPQRRPGRPPRARVIAPSEKRQHGKRNRDERNHAPSYHDVPTMGSPLCRARASQFQPRGASSARVAMATSTIRREELGEDMVSLIQDP